MSIITGVRGPNRSSNAFATSSVRPASRFFCIQPLFAGNESRYVQQCIDSGWVSSAGQFVNDFERQLCAITGAKFAVAVINGTAALHVALMLAGVERGTEVLMPSLTFVATANAAAYLGAVPHFCDVSVKTLGLDPAKLAEYLNSVAEQREGASINRQTGRKISAIVPMHTFGHPVDLAALVEVARRWGIPIVEDAAESLGSLYRGRHTGTFGLMSALSFNGNKIVSTGAGGALLTDDPALAKRARHLTTTAKVPHPYEYIHDEVGFNYRMPNLNAALGCAQLERLDAFVDRKRGLARSYHECVRGNGRDHYICRTRPGPQLSTGSTPDSCQGQCVTARSTTGLAQ